MKARFLIVFVVVFGSFNVFASPRISRVCGPEKGFTIFFKSDGHGSRKTYRTYKTLQVEGEKEERNLSCKLHRFPKSMTSKCIDDQKQYSVQINLYIGKKEAFVSSGKKMLAKNMTCKNVDDDDDENEME